MTNSAKPTEPAVADHVAGSDPLPVARVPAPRRAARFGGYLALGLVLVGWMFIVAQNRFEPSLPVIVVSLGWLAVVQSGFWLARSALETATEPATGAGADDDAWFRPTGKVGELQREKQSLLKAIKEVEFDRGLGKMSEADATSLLAMYRSKAIEVIKAIDEASALAETTGPRAEIERELRARLQIASAKAKRGTRAADAPAAKRGKGTKAKPQATPAADAAEPIAPPDNADAADGGDDSTVAS